MSAGELALRVAEEWRRVGIALQPVTMAAYLREALASACPPGIATPASAACRILDVKYEPGEYCSILYKLGERLVRGHYDWAPGASDTWSRARLIEPLGMRICSFEQDPALPGLETAIDPGAASAALQRALPECRSGEAQVLRCRPTLLRYRPGRRCTLRYDLWLRDAKSGAARRRTLYAKVYHDLAKAEAVREAMEMLADSAPAQERRFVAARVVAFLPELRLILQESVEGTPLELLLGGLSGPVTAGDRRGFDGVVRCAAALAALHAAPLSVRRERKVEAELARFARRAALAAQVDERIGGRLGELAAALPAWLPRVREWDERTTLVHGDAKPGQCLVTAHGIALLDFDHCGMADPATDVGAYLASLRKRSVQQAAEAGGAAAARRGWLRVLEEAFLDEYSRASGGGLALHWRATWYGAVALLRKAQRAFARSPRSPMPLALVDEAWRLLARLPSPA